MDALTAKLDTPVLTPAQTIKLRSAAEDFEAMLLTQLTSVLNEIGSDSESLFGQDGGTDLAKKLFSEQLASSLAKSGGIGLADTILGEFGLESNTPKAVTTTAFRKSEIAPVISTPTGTNLINRNGRTSPVIESFGDTPPLAVISTDAAQNADPADDRGWRAPFVDPALGIDLTDPSKQINPTAAPDTKFTMPVEGRISSRFGNRFHPIDKIQKFHSGIDIAAPKGTPIEAASDGVVTFAGPRGGLGNLVIIEHPDGKLTRYAHADSLDVETGENVTAGQKIGSVGSTGKSTGPHLHFEVIENGRPINPFSLLSQVMNQDADM